MSRRWKVILVVNTDALFKSIPEDDPVFEKPPMLLGEWEREIEADLIRRYLDNYKPELFAVEDIAEVSEGGAK